MSISVCKNFILTQKNMLIFSQCPHSSIDYVYVSYSFLRFMHFSEEKYFDNWSFHVIAWVNEVVNTSLLLWQEDNAKKENEKKSPEPPPKKPVLDCPICMAAFVEPMSTRCGHIFCRGCITTAISTQNKCPTCRKKVTKNQLIRVFLPSLS